MTMDGGFRSRDAAGRQLDLSAGTAGAIGDATTREELRNRAAVRSSELMQAIAALDTQASAVASAEVMEWIQQAYDERRGGRLLGLFGMCYLGVPYVDHIMTVQGMICEHFAAADSVPAPYAQARGLAQSPSYAFIEIYSDGSVVPVRPDGSPVL